MSISPTVSPLKDDSLSPLEDSFNESLDLNNVSNLNLSFEESTLSEAPPLPQVSSPQFKSNTDNLELSTSDTTSSIRSSRRRVMKHSSIVLNSDRLKRVMEHVESDSSHSTSLPLPPTIVEGDYSVIAGSEGNEGSEEKDGSSLPLISTPPSISSPISATSSSSSSPTSHEEVRSLSTLILFLMNNDKFISLVRGYRTRLFLNKHSKFLKLKSDMYDVLNVIKDIFINNQKLYDQVSSNFKPSDKFNAENFYFWIPSVNKYYSQYSYIIPHLDKHLINSSTRQILNYREELIKIFYNIANYVNTYSYYSPSTNVINEESTSNANPSTSSAVSTSIRASTSLNNLKKNSNISSSISSSITSSASISASVSAPLLNPPIPPRSYEGAQLLLRIISAEKLIAAKRGTNVEPDRKPCIKTYVYLPSSTSIGENPTSSTSVIVNSSSTLKRVFTHTIQMDKITLNPTYNVLLPITLPYPKSLLESLVEHEGICLKSCASSPVLSQTQYHNILNGLIQYWQRGYIYVEIYDKERFNETLFMGCVTLSLNLIFQPYLLSGKEINFNNPFILKNNIHTLDNTTLLSITTSASAPSSSNTTSSTTSNILVTSTGNGTIGGLCGNSNNSRSPRVSGLINTQCLWYSPEKKFIEDQLLLIYNQVNLNALQEAQIVYQQTQQEKLVASLASLKANKVNRQRSSLGGSSSSTTNLNSDPQDNSENIKSNLKLISKKLNSKQTETVSAVSASSKNESPSKIPSLSINPSVPSSQPAPITSRSRKVMLNNLFKQLDDLQIQAGEVCDSLSLKLEEKKNQREKQIAKQSKEEIHINQQKISTQSPSPTSESVQSKLNSQHQLIDEDYIDTKNDMNSNDISYSPYHKQDNWDSVLMDDDDNDEMNQTFLSEDVDINDNIKFENYEDDEIYESQNTSIYQNSNLPRSSFDLHEDYFNNSLEEIKDNYNLVNKEDEEENDDLIVIPRSIPHINGARNPDTVYPVHLRKKSY